MVERFPDDGEAAYAFGRRHLHEDEARLLYEEDYPAPPDMRVPGSWRLSAGGVPVPRPPSQADRQAEIADIRSSLQENSRNLSSHNSEGRCHWWGVTGRTLEVILEHIEGGNSPRYEYPPPPAFSHRRGSSWTPRHVEAAASSSSGSRSCSFGSPTLLPVQQELQEMSLGRRTCSGGIVINKPDASSHLVKPKAEPGLLPVKQEHLAIRKEGGIVILDDNDEEAPGPSNRVGHGDPGQGCSKDIDGVQDDDDGGDYTKFYKLLGMQKATTSGDDDVV
ncbi:Homeobox protein KNOX3 [Hordeum vulgare]|nr:Homeobox protein KNOX3 [Hordeum vulgare]